MTQFYENLKSKLSELSSKQDAISQAIAELKTTTEIESGQIQDKLSEFGLTDEQKAEILTMVGNIAGKADSAYVAVNEAQDAISNLVTETPSEPVAPPKPVAPTT